MLRTARKERGHSLLSANSPVETYRFGTALRAFQRNLSCRTVTGRTVRITLISCVEVPVT
jgi:hypothetical protein